MPRISAKVLAKQLRELIADGIVEQRRTGRVPAPVVYSLTEYGQSIVPIAESVRRGAAVISSASLNCPRRLVVC